MLKQNEARIKDEQKRRQEIEDQIKTTYSKKLEEMSEFKDKASELEKQNRILKSSQGRVVTPDIGQDFG